MKFSREMKDYFRESMGNSLAPSHAADYLINLFLDEAWEGRDYEKDENPEWSCLIGSKAYRDMIEAFRWCDEAWGGRQIAAFKIALFDKMRFQFPNNAGHYISTAVIVHSTRQALADLAAMTDDIGVYGYE